MRYWFRCLKLEYNWVKCDTNKLKTVAIIVFSGFWWHMSQLCHGSKWESVKEDMYSRPNPPGFLEMELNAVPPETLPLWTLFCLRVLHSFPFSSVPSCRFLAIQNCFQSLQCRMAPLTFSLFNSHLWEQVYSYSVCCAAVILEYAQY